MTLQSSGPISLANVQTEFGGANPISLSEYYGSAPGIPASGAISLGAFYGKSSVPPSPAVTLTPSSISRFGSNVFNPVTLSDAVAISRTGGTAPFTTTAVRLSGSPSIGHVLNSPSQITISSTLGAGIGPVTLTAVFRVTITDSLGNSGFKDITVVHEYSGN